MTEKRKWEDTEQGKKADSGGNIYPQPTGCITTDMKGLTRRDWLAGLAMPGMLAASGDGETEIEDFKAIPALAYRFADAMIAEGEK